MADDGPDAWATDTWTPDPRYIPAMWRSACIVCAHPFTDLTRRERETHLMSHVWPTSQTT